MTDIHRVTRPNRRRFLFGSAGGVVSYALGLSPTLSQPLHSTARIMVGFPAGGPSDVLARPSEKVTESVAVRVLPCEPTTDSLKVIESISARG